MLKKAYAYDIKWTLTDALPSVWTTKMPKGNIHSIIVLEHDNSMTTLEHDVIHTPMTGQIKWNDFYQWYYNGLHIRHHNYGNFKQEHKFHILCDNTIFPNNCSHFVLEYMNIVFYDSAQKGNQELEVFLSQFSAITAIRAAKLLANQTPSVEDTVRVSDRTLHYE